MNSRSAKNKGLRLQKFVRSLLLKHFQMLSEEDIRSAMASQKGEDLILSKKAKKIFPFAIECKNVERLNVWQAWDQAQRHASKLSLEPLLVISKNRKKPLVVIDLDRFLRFF